MAKVGKFIFDASVYDLILDITMNKLIEYLKWKMIIDMK